MERLLKKHKYNYNTIYTTNRIWSTEDSISIKKARIYYNAKIISLRILEHIRLIAKFGMKFLGVN